MKEAVDALPSLGQASGTLGQEGHAQIHAQGIFAFHTKVFAAGNQKLVSGNQILVSSSKYLLNSGYERPQGHFKPHVSTVYVLIWYHLSTLEVPLVVGHPAMYKICALAPLARSFLCIYQLYPSLVVHP